MSKLSSERKGRITGSRIGAVLGLNPYCSRNQALKEMVLEYLGKPIVKSNADIQRGVILEPVAISKYKNNMGMDLEVKDAGFRVHKKYHFLGATPDGLVCFNKKYKLKNRLLEVKAPRKLYEGIPPYYEAQIQLQLHCFELELCDFVQIINDELFMNQVGYDNTFLSRNLGSLEGFMEDFHNSLKNSENFYLEALSMDLKEIRETQKKLKSKEDALKQDILSHLKYKNISTDFLRVSEVLKAGGYDYKKFCEDRGFEIPDSYKKKDTLIKVVSV